MRWTSAAKASSVSSAARKATWQTSIERERQASPRRNADSSMPQGEQDIMAHHNNYTSSTERRTKGPQRRQEASEKKSKKSQRNFHRKNLQRPTRNMHNK
jgi:enterochelin esterase-like enzyme